MLNETVSPLTSKSCSLANAAASWGTRKDCFIHIWWTESTAQACAANLSNIWRLHCESLVYRLIAEQHINVGHNLHEVILEELADEGRREVQAKQLVIFRRMLRHFQDGLQRDGQEETLEVNSDTGSRLICFFLSHKVRSWTETAPVGLKLPPVWWLPTITKGKWQYSSLPEYK